MVVALSTLVAGLKAATLTWFGIKSIKFGLKLGKAIKKEHQSVPKFPSGKVKKFYKSKGVSRQTRARCTTIKDNISERIKEIIEECLNDALISSFHNKKNQQKNVRARDVDEDDEIINSLVKSNFSGCSSDSDCCIASQNDANASLAIRTYVSNASPTDADASLSPSTSLFAAITNESDASLSSSASLFARLAAITNECEASLASSSSAVSKELQTLWEEWGPMLETGEDSSSTVDLNSTLEEMLDCDPMLEKDDSFAEDNQSELSEEVFYESRLVIDLEVNDKDMCDGSNDNGTEEMIEEDFEDDKFVTISNGDLGVADEVVNAVSTTDDSIAEDYQVELPEEVFDERRLVIDLEVEDKDTCNGSNDHGREKVIEEDSGDDEVDTISNDDLGVGYDIIDPFRSTATDNSMAEDNQVELPEEVLDERNESDNGRDKLTLTTNLVEEENDVVLVCIKGNTTFLNHTLPIINIKKEDFIDDEEYEVVTISDDEVE